MKILNIGAYRISFWSECPISAKCSIIGISTFVPDYRPGSSGYPISLTMPDSDMPMTTCPDFGKSVLVWWLIF